MALTGLWPYAHVADVQRSVKLLLAARARGTEHAPRRGRLVWAFLTSTGRAGSGTDARARRRPVDPDVQAVLFYCWSPDVVALRDELAPRRSRIPSTCRPASFGSPTPMGTSCSSASSLARPTRGRPRARRQRERRVGKPRATALPQLRPSLRVEPGDVLAGGADSERERLPPLLEARVLDARPTGSCSSHVREARLRREELGQLAFARTRPGRDSSSASRVELAQPPSRTRSAARARRRGPRRRLRRRRPVASPVAISPTAGAPGPS